MIRNCLGLGLIGVDCPQRGVLCDGNLIARVDELAVFHFPSAEVFGIFRRKYAGGAAAYILLVIRCNIYIRTLNVCDREAILCGGEERGNRNGAVKLGIYIEQRAVGIDPSGGLFFCEFLVKQLFKLFRIRKLCAVRNFNRFGSSVRRGRQVNRSFNNRRLPLCIERNVLCGHRLAGEVIRRAFAKLIIIPACKRKVCGYTGRFCRGVVDIGNILLILAANLAILCTVIHENDIIGFTGIVEFSIVVFRLIFSLPKPTTIKPFVLCFEFLKFKSGYRILILIRYNKARAGAYISMVFFVRHTIMLRSTLTRQNFYIIICCLTAFTCSRAIELGTA